MSRHTTRRFFTLLHACFLILILLIAFWLRLDDLDAMPPGISGDESFNTVDSLILAQTGQLPRFEDVTRPNRCTARFWRPAPCLDRVCGRFDWCR